MDSTVDSDDCDDETVTEALKAHYGTAARTASTSSCGPAPAGVDVVFGSSLYDPCELTDLPEQAAAGSLGCANPVYLAELAPGEDVLDLGSGGGIDVLLSAERVGPGGRVYGVDMTPDMVELARANQRRAAVTNAEFLEGRIEAVPLPDQSVDVVMSNCVINQAVDKKAVFHEAYRVLRPGGRLAVADVIADQTADARGAEAADWVACTAGAITRDRYRAMLEEAGFVGAEIEDSHRVADGLWSVLVRARKSPS